MHDQDFTTSQLCRRLGARRIGTGLFVIVAASMCTVLLLPQLAHAATLRLSPNLTELRETGEHARSYRNMFILFQIAVILASAKLFGWIAEKFKVPGVLGELLAGAIVGPFLLGYYIPLPIAGHWLPLFPRPLSPGQWPINDVIWSLAQVASIVLLFVTGLHTDLRQFLRYVGPASLIATLGLLAPFALGAGTVYIPFFADLSRPDAGGSVLVPALFMGAILAATSIGITARVLGDIDKLDTPEGVTIIGAAVLDDVLGIIALAIVGGIQATHSVAIGSVGIIAAKAFGFWIGLTLLTLLLARPIEWVVARVRYAGAMVAIGLAIAFVASAAAEGFGLAFIIGAYSVGLGLSRTKLAHQLMDELQPIFDFIVPIFFAALGMLVNFGAMFSRWEIVAFGLVVTAAAIIGKLIGCGAAALGTGFNLRGAYRIGIGMMPRGEVALIVAGVALSQQIIQPDVFGVSIMMTLLTTILAPILLVPAFRTGGSGRWRGARAAIEPEQQPGLVIPIPPELGDVLVNRMLSLAQQRGWAPVYDRADEEVYLLRRADDAAQLRMVDGSIHIDASNARISEFKNLLNEARRSLVQDLNAARG